MFGSTQFTVVTSNFARPKSPRPASGRPTSPTYRGPITGSPTRILPSSKPTQTIVSSNNNEIREKFKNSTFNRQPSPPEMIRSGSPTQGVRNTLAINMSKDKEIVKTPKVRPVREQRSEIIRKSLQTKSTKVIRPQTAVTKRTADKGVQESPSFQGKILLTVKDVLGTLISQKNTIDGSDIDRVMDYISARLHNKEYVIEDDDGLKKIDVEPKCSKTNINIDSSSCRLSSGRKKSSIGIAQNAYKKFSGVPATTLNVNQSNRNVLCNETKALFDDIADNNSEKGKTTQDERKGSDIKESNESKNQLGREVNQKEEKVGDSQHNNSKSLDIWKAIEETDLRSYIESLVNKMNQELTASDCQRIVEKFARAKDKERKSFLDSNICQSDCNSPRKPVTRSPSKHITSRVSCKASSTGVKVPRSNIRIAESSCRVLKRNCQPQPESADVFQTHPAAPKVRTQGDLMAAKHKVIDPVPTNESNEDLYLQRRRTQAVKKDGVKVIHFGK